MIKELLRMLPVRVIVYIMVLIVLLIIRLTLGSAEGEWQLVGGEHGLNNLKGRKERPTSISYV